ncbi:hypothetical protein SBA4_2750005 [Candidatus Sulfopaludibacter sp. SbA4]|nr:hypothetical protein SBA4_2750005 [Candidatus Sulfopaludibacter sp. SbA4]
MAATGNHPVWGDTQLCADCGGHRVAERGARGGCGEWRQPGSDRGSVPSGDREQRQVGGVRWRIAAEEAAARVGRGWGLGGACGSRKCRFVEMIGNIVGISACVTVFFSERAEFEKWRVQPDDPAGQPSERDRPQRSERNALWRIEAGLRGRQGVQWDLPYFSVAPRLLAAIGQLQPGRYSAAVVERLAGLAGPPTPMYTGPLPITRAPP